MQDKLNDFDPLKDFRVELKKEILKNYKSIEEFCYANDISKSILSRLITGKRKEFKIETLQRISKALNKNVQIKLID